MVISTTRPSVPIKSCDRPEPGPEFVIFYQLRVLCWLWLTAWVLPAWLSDCKSFISGEPHVLDLITDNRLKTNNILGLYCSSSLQQREAKWPTQISYLDKQDADHPPQPRLIRLASVITRTIPDLSLTDFQIASEPPATLNDNKMLNNKTYSI